MKAPLANPRDLFTCLGCGREMERREIVRPDELTIACPSCGSNALQGAGRVVTRTT